MVIFYTFSELLWLKTFEKSLLPELMTFWFTIGGKLGEGRTVLIRSRLYRIIWALENFNLKGIVESIANVIFEQTFMVATI